MLSRWNDDRTNPNRTEPLPSIFALVDAMYRRLVEEKIDPAPLLKATNHFIDPCQPKNKSKWLKK
jgi:hypothetical protein